MKRLRMIACVVAAFAAAACSKKPDESAQRKKDVEPAPTGNVVAIPENVRRNLGITFVRVTQRVVAGTVRYPGRFEAPPDATQEHHASAAGRVTLLVKQFDRVVKGTELYRLDAPRVRELRREIAAAESDEHVATAEIESLPAYREAHLTHEAALKGSVALWTKRVTDLEALQVGGSGRIDELSAARVSLETAKSEVAQSLEKSADLEARASRLAATRTGLATRAALLRDELTALAGAAGTGPLEIVGRAAVDGVVAGIDVSQGSWAEVGARLLVVADPTRVRFRAAAPQADLSRLKDGTVVRIVPQVGGGDALAARNGIAAILQIGLAGDPDERTFDVFATPTEFDATARPGVVGALQIVPEGASDDLSIERAAVLKDGLVSVFFRRDPKKPDQVLRTEADLGATDGRYVVVRSGVKEGDEIVLGGAYQLVLATSGTAQKGGHFHADGTFHAEGEEEK